MVAENWDLVDELVAEFDDGHRHYVLCQSLIQAINARKWARAYTVAEEVLSGPTA